MNYYPALLAGLAILCILGAATALNSSSTSSSTEQCVTQQLNGYIICPGSQQPVHQAPVTYQTTNYDALGYTLLCMAGLFLLGAVLVGRIRG